MDWTTRPSTARNTPTGGGSGHWWRTHWALIGLLLALLILLAGGLVLAVGDTPVIGSAIVGPQPFPLVGDDVSARAFAYASPNASNSLIGTVTVIDTPSGRALHTTAIGPRVAFGPTAAFAAVDRHTGHVFVDGDDGSIAMLDASTGRLLHILTDTASPDNRQIVADEQTARVFIGHRDESVVTMIDGRSGAMLRRIAVCGSPFALGLSGRLGRVFVKCNDGTTDVLDARMGRVLRGITTGTAWGTVVADEQTGRVFVISDVAGQLSVLDARTGTLVRTLPLGGFAATDERSGHVFLARVLPNATGSHEVIMLDGRTGAVLRHIPVAANPGAPVVDPQTGHVFIASVGPVDASGNPSTYGTLTILDGASGTVVRTMNVGFNPGDMLIDGRARRLLVSHPALAYNPSWPSGPLTASPPESGWQQARRRVLVALQRALPSWLPVTIHLPL